MKPDANNAAIDDFIDGLTLLEIDHATTLTFARTKAALRRAGTLIEDFDLVIAATALRHDLTLVTNNQRHFSRIPNLRLESWL